MDCNPEINDKHVRVAENSVKEMAIHAISNSNIEKNDESVVSNEMVEKHLNEMMKKSQEIYTGDGQFTTIDRTEFPLQKDQSCKEIREDSATNKTVLPNQQNVILVKIPTQYLDYICQFCSKDFSSKSSLKEHLIIHSGEQPFSCDICDKKFNKKGNLMRHHNTHGGEKKHTCGICGKSFNHACTLKDHMKRHTGEKPHECEICKRQFSEKCNLKKHMVLHSGIKPYSCDYCDKPFFDAGNLAKHILIHTGQRPYQCDICGKKFRYGNTLKRHQRIHTGEAPFPCPVCNKAFFSNGELHNHSVIHTGVKRFKCEVCSKCFSRNHHLHQHMKKHTGEKPYACDVCGSRFVQTSGFRKHMRTFHPSVPTEWQDLPDSNRTSDDFVQPNSNVSKKETKYTCEICGVKFVHGATYQKHSLIYHEKSIPKTWARALRLKKVKSNVKHVKATTDDKLTESIKELIQTNEQFLIKTEPP